MSFRAVSNNLHLLLLILLCTGCASEQLIKSDRTIYPILHEYPAWSNDGEHILFRNNGIVCVEKDGRYLEDPDSIGLWIINSDGSNPRMLIENGTQAQWSGDDQTIVFVIDRQIFKASMNDGELDTLSIVQLTSMGMNIFPSWTYDDSSIVYEHKENAGDSYSIWRMQSDGLMAEQLIQARSPGCSRVGDSIAVLISTYEGYDIAIYNSNGSYLYRLTDSDADKRYPQYSPLGGFVAYLSFTSGKSSLRIVNTKDQNITTVISNVQDAGLTWNHNCDKIAYSLYSSVDFKNNGTIWIVDLTTKANEQLTSGL